MSVASGKSDPLPIEMREVAVGTLDDSEAIRTQAVNWQVRSGEFWVVAGLQGTGKTDFLMTTAGLMPPRAGDYRLFGEPMPIFEGARLATRLRLGLVFDGGQLLTHLTVFDNVALPLQYHRNLSRREVEEAVRTLLAATELLPWSASTPGMMPRAWQKRAGLARALILQPELLLLDCPLSGLDARHAAWWLRFLDGLSRGGAPAGNRPMTLVVASEDLRPWRGRATRFAALESQRFDALGGWADVEHSSDPAVRLLLEGHATGEQVGSP